jgi:glycosyltransferase involved in cell wall biosynthesis
VSDRFPPPPTDRPAVTIIIPTRNESPNISMLVDRVTAAMDGVARWELLFVDDSDDDTPAAVDAQRARDRPVRLYHRPAGRRPGGLSGAVEDGFDSAEGSILAVMDADLQHPPEVLPGLLAPLLAGEADLVAGTRYGESGQASGLSGPWRRAVSTGSRLLVHALVPRSRPLSDPLSGLFALRREVIDDVPLQANGFKILLEVVTRGRWARMRNHPYRFDRRFAGRSKASVHEGILFGRHLAHLARIRGEPPPVLPATSPAEASPARRSSV